jgi:predicted acyltransferase
MYLWGALGGFCILIGCLIALGNPVNKKLWSPSFAYITSGIAACGLALCYLLVDILKGPSSRVRTAILKPFLWLGMNPLFVFVAMIFFDNLLMNNIKWGTGSGKRSLWGYLDEVWLNSWLRNEYVSSTVFSLLNLILWMAMARLLYNRNIFIKL